jgi:hypothetical protein
MTYTALAVLFLLLCVAIGVRTPAAARTRVAAMLALTMVVAQFALLVWSS